MLKPTPNDSETSLNTIQAAGTEDVNRFAGEPLEGSGFEDEIPDPEFEWRDQQ